MAVSDLEMRKAEPGDGGINDSSPGEVTSASSGVLIMYKITL